MNEYSLTEPLFNMGYAQAGAEAKLTGEDGKVYKGTLGYGPSFKIVLPFSDEQYNMEVNVLGHFTLHKTFNIGAHGKKEILFKTLEAGDVNKDDVIDVMDAVYIQEKWETSDRDADINFDGSVDAADGFVQKNYLLQNPSAANAPKAKENYKGKSLERIQEELGIQ
ncbi:MAG: dockerin type I repeat-containing protein [Bacillota bacterium]